MVESQPISNPAPGVSPFRGTFVGRQREMRELKAALDDAISGQGRLVMLAGEPGIGKTRTAQELGAHAETLGVQVFWGRCFEEEGTPPYWPWVQPIRSYVQQQDPGELADLMRAGAASIAEIVPQLREKLPNLEPPPTLEPEQARFRLFDSITTFLKTAAQARPLMLVLDDLHWSDRPSLLLLQFLARQLGEAHLLVVGTYRDVELSRQHPLSETLAELSREPVFQRELLRGLSSEDAGRFIEATTGIQPHPRLAETIYAHTEGNPFFMTEVVQLLSEQDKLTASGGETAGLLGMRIPEGVREVIGARLNRLSEDCNGMLSTASVIGREFGFEMLRALRSEISYDRLLEALEEALAARVIEEQGAGQYQFAHALIQETLAAELSTLRRVRLHATIGETLEELYGANVEAHATELAHHFAEAATAAANEKLAHYSLVAGDQALSTYAYEEAQTHFERALAAKEGQPMDGETANLLFGMGRALVVTLDRHRVHEGLDRLNQAFDYYVEAGDISRAVAVAECPLPPYGGQGTGMGQLLLRALDLVAPDSHEAGRLLSLYGRIKGHQEGDFQAAQEALDRALAIAQREGDASLEMRTLAAAAYVDFTRLRHSDCNEKGLRVLELNQRFNDPSALLLALFGSIYTLCAVGNLDEARRQAAACVAAGEKFGDRFWFAGALLRQVSVLMLEGYWQAARELSDRALAVSELDPRNLGKRVLLEHEVGDWDRGREFVKRQLEARQLQSPAIGAGQGYPAAMIPFVARMSGDLSWLSEAQQAARTILSADIATPLWSLAARMGLAMAAVVTEDDEEAREQYNAISPHRGTLLTQTNMSADRLLGLLSQTMGNHDQAVAHFEGALTFCRQAGYRPELAWSCHDYAELLLVAAHAREALPENRAKAMSLLDESLAISTELGMLPLMERVVALQERAASQPAKAPAFPDGLTSREVGVLQLIAAGKTDREIAEELVISVKTVGNHVSNILNKTSTANRTEAATYATRQGLV